MFFTGGKGETLLLSRERLYIATEDGGGYAWRCGDDWHVVLYRRHHTSQPTNVVPHGRRCRSRPVSRLITYSCSKELDLYIYSAQAKVAVAVIRRYIAENWTTATMPLKVVYQSIARPGPIELIVDTSSPPANEERKGRQSIEIVLRGWRRSYSIAHT